MNTLKTVAAMLGMATILGTATSAAGDVSFTSGGNVDAQSAMSLAESQGQTRIIVELKEPASWAAFARSGEAGEAAYEAANRALQGGVLESVFASASGRGLKQMDVVPMFSLSATASEIAALEADSRVARIWPDRLLKPTLNEAVAMVRMTGTGGGYAKGATGKGRVVAVLDTGVNSSNEFLTGKVIEEACYNTTGSVSGGTSTSQCPSGDSATGPGSGADCPPTVDGCGHGTHVAGIAAGLNPTPAPGEPNHGVAKNGFIMAVNVFSRVNSATSCGSSDPCALAFTSDIIQGLQRVYKKRKNAGGRPVAAVNMSLGGGSTGSYCEDPTKPIISKLRAEGIATVIAAGNDLIIGGVAFPACVKGAITVAALTKKTPTLGEKLAIYSNIGKQVDTMAPGGDITMNITAPVNSGLHVSYPFGSTPDLILSSYESGYNGLAGTSMASPAVAGIIAALKSRKACRGKSVGAVEKALRNSGKKVTDWRPAFYGLPSATFPTLTRRSVNIVSLMKELNCY